MAFRLDSGYRIPRKEVSRLLAPRSMIFPIDISLIFSRSSGRQFGVAPGALYKGYIMAPIKLEILDIVLQSGVAKATGRPYEIHRAQCVLHGSDGGRKIGELNLPRDLAETKPGTYMASFELAVSMDRLIIPRIIALTPAAPDRAAPPASAPKA